MPARLADAKGALQAIIATMDRRTDAVASIARRSNPDLEASYKDHWAFRNPLWDNAAALPVGQEFSLDTLMPRDDFVKAPVFNMPSPFCRPRSSFRKPAYCRVP
ncbi:MAG: hypothetical protein ACRECN_07590 [Methylocella sp.]